MFNYTKSSIMKRLLFIVVMVFFTVMTSYAQYSVEGTRKEREYMIMDGANPDFIRAQQLSPTQLSIGVVIPGEKGEGVYEIRDNKIWLTNRRHGADELIATVTQDENSGNMIFRRAFSGMPADVEGEIIGGLSANIILDRSEEPIASIQSMGDVVLNNGTVCLKIDKADELLVAFYFINSYMLNITTDIVE